MNIGAAQFGNATFPSSKGVLRKDVAMLQQVLSLEMRFQLMMCGRRWLRDDGMCLGGCEVGIYEWGIS
jgi:hypothetical protein